MTSAPVKGAVDTETSATTTKIVSKLDSVPSVISKSSGRNIGIVGHEAAKFDLRTEHLAREVIRGLLTPADTVVSGGCHLGGIDLWAEEEGDRLGCEKLIHLPQQRSWEGGYKQRNLLIARDSDEVHCIVVARLPEGFKGMRFPFCYHCNTAEHVKSGGCWTAKRAKKGVWHVIE